MLPVLGCILLNAAQALDLTTIDRSIKREPTYQHRPGYCLLVFGAEARTRVWLVVDGRRLYIDLNGNGDLTERAEWTTFHTADSARVAQIREVDGTIHTDFSIKLFDDDRFACLLNHASKGRQWVGHYTKNDQMRPRLAKRPQDAPIIHFNGPMEFARDDQMPILAREPTRILEPRTWLPVTVGTSGLGEATFAHYGMGMLFDYGVDKVTLDVECPAIAGSAHPITFRKQVLVEKLLAGFYSRRYPVTVPQDAGAGFAKITVSMPDWKKGSIAPVTLEGLIVGGAQDFPIARVAMQTANPVDRAQIAYVLGRLDYWKGPQRNQLFQLLAGALDDPDFGVRANAAKSLAAGRRESLQAIPQLVTLLGDRNQVVRQAAVQAIVAIDVSAVGPIIDDLKASPDNDQIVHELAKRALKELGFGVHTATASAGLRIYVDSHYKRKSFASAVGLFRHVNDLSGLRLSNTSVTDESLKHITVVTNLRRLYLSETQITDEGLKQIAVLTDLRRLDVSETRITDDGLVHLMKLGQLTHLYLRGTPITSAGLVHLQPMQGLTSLNLRQTSVDDTAMMHIVRLKNLKHVYLDKDKFSDEARAKLKQQLPTCNVH